mgnify:CR=1 FL=1|jgi:hypothetical protein
MAVLAALSGYTNQRNTAGSTTCFTRPMIWLTINRIFDGNLFRLAYEEMLYKTDHNFGGTIKAYS